MGPCMFYVCVCQVNLIWASSKDGFKGDSVENIYAHKKTGSSPRYGFYSETLDFFYFLWKKLTKAKQQDCKYFIWIVSAFFFKDMKYVFSREY